MGMYGSPEVSIIIGQEGVVGARVGDVIVCRS